MLARVLPAALEVTSRHHGLARMVAPRVIDVAVVGGLARDLAHVPPDESQRPAHSNSSSRVNRPLGARSVDSEAGTSVDGSGSRERMAFTQMRAASRITMTIRMAKNAARMPSTV